MSSLFDDVYWYEKDASDSLSEHASSEIGDKGMVLEELSLKHSAFAELVTTEIEASSWN